MKILGKPTINPFLFYTGKISGYLIWMVFFLSYKYEQLRNVSNQSLFLIAHFLYGIGLLFSIGSLFKLGSSVSLGLPDEQTELQTGGLYRISRNPMYLGFNLLTLATSIQTMNLVVISFSVYSIVVYHLIILGEEAFLSNRFGQTYIEYSQRVRRYL